MRLEHRTIQYRQPGLHKEGGEEWYFGLQRLGCPGKGDIRVLPILILRINKSPTLNNHIQKHLHLTLACGMKDCWFVTHSSDLMWKHAASHGLTISEPIAVNTKKK